MIVKEEIEKRLSNAIKQSGLTQEYIAEKLGVKPSMVEQYVSGKSLPRVNTFARLCALLGISASEILGVK